MFELAVFAITITMGLALIRAIIGPTPYDRILGVNMVSTKTVLLIAAAGFMRGRPERLDLSLVYGLMSFIALLAVLRFSKYGNLGDDEPVER